jgi:hypothetical protein
MIRSQPEVTEILRRVRVGVDIDSILRYVKDGDLLLQLHLLPETRLRYSFPDFASWPTLFRDPSDPYLKTQLLDFDDSNDASLVAGRATPLSSHIYQMPYHAAEMIDPRLSSVKAAKWTSVTTDDALVVKLLAVFLQYEYPRTRVFQKDLFLDDLVQGKTNFCSSLLVNCILANAAVRSHHPSKTQPGIVADHPSLNNLAWPCHRSPPCRVLDPALSPLCLPSRGKEAVGH